jgi:hypothetical protein
VHWSIKESDGSRVVGEGDTTLSVYGGWEAEWNVPEKAKLGSYEVRCAVGGSDYAGVTVISVQEYRVPLFSVMVEQRRQKSVPPRMRGSPLLIFTAHRTQERGCTGKRVGQHWRTTSAIPTNHIESVSTLTPRSVRASMSTVKTSKQSRATRSSMRMVSRRSPANRRSKTIPPSAARTLSGARTLPQSTDKPLAAATQPRFSRQKRVSGSAPKSRLPNPPAWRRRE